MSMLSYEFLKDVWERYPDEVLSRCKAVVDLYNPDTAHLFCNSCFGHLHDCCDPWDEGYYGKCQDPLKCAWEMEFNS